MWTGWLMPSRRCRNYPTRALVRCDALDVSTLLPEMFSQRCTAQTCRPDPSCVRLKTVVSTALLSHAGLATRLIVGCCETCAPGVLFGPQFRTQCRDVRATRESYRTLAYKCSVDRAPGAGTTQHTTLGLAPQCLALPQERPGSSTVCEHLGRLRDGQRAT